jgi:hypothetical protein
MISKVWTSVSDFAGVMPLNWRQFINQELADEISSLTKYSDEVIYFQPRPMDSGLLLEKVKCRAKSVSSTFEGFADHPVFDSDRKVLLLNGNFNHNYDIQDLMIEVRKKLNRFSRVVVVAYNPYFSWLYKLASHLGIRKDDSPSTFVTKNDLVNICLISGFKVVRMRPIAYCPFRLFGVGKILNRILSVTPLLRNLSLTNVISLRPVIPDARQRMLSIVIPARNEKGNIENAILRLPSMPAKMEIIFVEGHSTDGTWEEILRVQNLYADRVPIKALRQMGKGKADAVHAGFREASGDLLTILDADLTMPPELLPRFLLAFYEGLGDFINGTRLVYPMEGEAMRFLNLLGNVFFAKALSYVLDSALADSLCGTKLITKVDYQRLLKWRDDFGDFDPFGDFELLFCAASLGLGIIDIPIRYRARSYGTTNISRFRHGFQLLRMTAIGMLKIKLRD